MNGECFLMSVDHDFMLKDFIFNIEPCLKEVYPNVKTDLLANFSETHLINLPVFKQLNDSLETKGGEMGQVHLYDDQFHFLFFDKKNKKKIDAIFDSLGMQIGDHDTLFEDYKQRQKTHNK